MKKIRVGVNGATGRIGKLVSRFLLEGRFPGMVLVAINVPSGIERAREQLLLDSVHGRFGMGIEVEVEDQELWIDGDHRVFCHADRDPFKVPWAEDEVDIVLECSGKYKDATEAGKLLAMGANRVLISCPAKSGADATIVHGVNHELITPEMTFVSNSSCTTNALATLGSRVLSYHQIVSGQFTTIHSVTRSQNITDATHRDDQRRARSGMVNALPTTTGAGKGLGIVLPALQGMVEGICWRMPTLNGSALDVTFNLDAEMTTQELQRLLARLETDGDHYVTTDLPYVLTDVIGEDATVVIDLGASHMIGGRGRKARIIAWYDNEWGFALQMLRVAQHWCSLS